MLSSSSNFHRVYTYMYLLYVHGRTYTYITRKPESSIILAREEIKLTTFPRSFQR